MSATAKSRVYLAIIGVLLLVLAAIAYKFIVAGSTKPGDDGRVAVVLEPGERALMLREMRQFVSGLQLVADGLSRGDMQAVAKASRDLGTAKAHDVPVSMMAKLPIDFKRIAFDTHHAFDAIAADAEANGTPAHTLTQISGVLQNCVACHARYQIAIPAQAAAE